VSGCGVAGRVAGVVRLGVGEDADGSLPPATLLPLPPDVLPPCGQRRATQLRLVSVFRQGWLAIVVALLNQQRLPIGRFVPEPWPRAEVEKATLKVIHEIPLAA